MLYLTKRAGAKCFVPLPEGAKRFMLWCCPRARMGRLLCSWADAGQLSLTTSRTMFTLRKASALHLYVDKSVLDSYSGCVDCSMFDS